MDIQKLQRALKERAEPKQGILRILSADPHLRKLLPGAYEKTEAELGELGYIWAWSEANKN